MSNGVISFRVNEDVIKHIHELGINDVANKVERFLIMLLEASLDGQKHHLKKSSADYEEIFGNIKHKTGSKPE
jgi:hypothetical protein